MIETLDLSKFKTGLELEKEFNRIIRLVIKNEITHSEADGLLDEIYEYGLNSGKFSEKDNIEYIERRNTHNDGRERTHLEFALNLSRSQIEEHRVYMYFIEWLKNNTDKEVKWNFYGSDYDGYIFIVDYKNRNIDVTNPDYNLFMGSTLYFTEVKSFYSIPRFKIINLIKYVNLKKCYLVFKYAGRYYSMGLNGLKKLLTMERGYNWKQETVDVSQKDINDLLKKKLLMELKC